MNLKELKSMIKEELEGYMRENEDEMEVSADAAMDDVAVDGDEMDMEAGGGAEDTLRAIYDQLAAYFEGGEVEDEMDELPGEEGEEGEEDMDMGDEEPMEEAKKEDDLDEAKKEDDLDEAKKDKDELKERFQKLANIIKG